MKELSRHAHAAKLIRKELKNSFPHTTFQVTTKSYSMGENVNIHWTNGVPTEAVNKIVKKYQYGTFDGMRDIYENSNERADLPQVKFVFTRHEITNDVYQSAFEYIKPMFNNLKDLELDTCYKNKMGDFETPREFLNMFLFKLDLTNGLNLKELDDCIFNKKAA